MKKQNNEDFQNNQDDFLQDQNQIVLGVHFFYNKNNREVAMGFVNVNERKMFVGEFQDNEHFSNFESLILQTNPQNSYTNYSILIQYPALQTEKDKITDILNVLDIQVLEKQKQSFPDLKQTENKISFLLKRDYKNHIREQQNQRGLQALSLVVDHLNLQSEDSNQKQFSLEQYTLSQYMKLDMAALNALLIFPKNLEANTRSNSGNTLVELLDKCKTQIGSRCLKRWLKQPLQNLQEIQRRLDIVEVFIKDSELRKKIQEDFLRKIPDLDKLYAKFYKVNSNKKHNGGLIDCIKVYQLVTNLRSLNKFLEGYLQDKHEAIEQFYYQPLNECLNQFNKLEEMVERAIDLEKAKEGEYIISSNFSKPLQAINVEIKKVQQLIEKLRKEVENDLDNCEIKLIDSNTYTYLFEIKKKEGDAAFRNSRKKYNQVSVKGRVISFNNDKLVSLVGQYNEQMNQYKEEQKTVVNKILQVVSTYYPAMERASILIQELDVLCSFAHVSANAPTPYCKPTMIQEGQLYINESKHPCLEFQDSQNCVANTCHLDASEKLHIITGPNMGGKSTYIRQIAISVLMAHIGCFLPAVSAKIPIIDAIITRVGASDMQLRGISTFMQEMLEAACMLKIATEKSLVIVDELGRGTSTSEGFGLAWAIAEYIVTNIRCFCLFATHFHEMTMMESQIPGVKNYYVSAIIKQNKLTMLYKVKEGAIDRSYGLFVAEMLKFPQQILNDAKKKAKELENYENFIENKQEDDMEIEEEEDGDENQMHNEDNTTNQNQDVTKDQSLKNLAKNASTQQKLSIIRLTENFQRNLNSDNQMSEEEKRKYIIEFKNQVMNELLKNNN